MSEVGPEEAPYQPGYQTNDLRHLLSSTFHHTEKRLSTLKARIHRHLNGNQDLVKLVSPKRMDSKPHLHVLPVCMKDDSNLATISHDETLPAMTRCKHGNVISCKKVIEQRLIHPALSQVWERLKEKLLLSFISLLEQTEELYPEVHPPLTPDHLKSLLVNTR